MPGHTQMTGQPRATRARSTPVEQLGTWSTSANRDHSFRELQAFCTSVLVELVIASLRATVAPDKLPRLGERFGIGDGDLVFQNIGTGQADALHDAHRVAVGRSISVE